MKSEKIVVDDIEYEVTELTMEVLWPILEGDAKNITKNMIKACVFVEGKQVGNDINKLGFCAYSKIMNAANKLNGFADDEDEKK